MEKVYQQNNFERLPTFMKKKTPIFDIFQFFFVTNVAKHSPYWLMVVTLRRQIKASIRWRRLNTALEYCFFPISFGIFTFPNLIWNIYFFQSHLEYLLFPNLLNRSSLTVLYLDLMHEVQ